MARCKYCGTELTDGVKFCTNCGGKVEVEPAPAPMPETYAQPDLNPQVVIDATPNTPPALSGGAKGFGIASMLCGIFALVNSCSCVYPIYGIIFAIIALILSILALVFSNTAAKKNLNGAENKFAKAGKVLGTIGLILSIIGVIVSIIVTIAFFAYLNGNGGDFGELFEKLGLDSGLTDIIDSFN